MMKRRVDSTIGCGARPPECNAGAPDGNQLAWEIFDGGDFSSDGSRVRERCEQIAAHLQELYIIVRRKDAPQQSTSSNTCKHGFEDGECAECKPRCAKPPLSESALHLLYWLGSNEGHAILASKEDKQAAAELRALRYVEYGEALRNLPVRLTEAGCKRITDRGAEHDYCETYNSIERVQHCKLCLAKKLK